MVVSISTRHEGSHMKRSIQAFTPSLIFGLLLAGNAIAAGDLSKDQVKAKLEAAGYTNVSDIRREKGHFDVKAMKDGQEVMLDVDAKTGAITPENEQQEAREHKDKY
jgi:predicted aspartyl protease